MTARYCHQPAGLPLPLPLSAAFFRSSRTSKYLFHSALVFLSLLDVWDEEITLGCKSGAGVAMAYRQQLALACSHTAEISTSRLQHDNRIRQSCTPGFPRIYRADLPWTRMYAGIYAYTYIIRIGTSQPYCWVTPQLHSGQLSIITFCSEAWLLSACSAKQQRGDVLCLAAAMDREPDESLHSCIKGNSLWLCLAVLQAWCEPVLQSSDED